MTVLMIICIKGLRYLQLFRPELGNIVCWNNFVYEFSRNQNN